MLERGTNANRTALRWERQGWDNKEVKKEGRGLLRDDFRQHPQAFPILFLAVLEEKKKNKKTRKISASFRYSRDCNVSAISLCLRKCFFKTKNY